MEHLLLSLLFYPPVILYIVMVICFWVQWRKLPPRGDDATPPATFLSVLIPTRNERNNIARLLERMDEQCYPGHLYEVLVIDDHSDDGTTSVIEDYLASKNNRTRLLRSAGTGKKAALLHGIGEASGRLIVTTDADCLPGRKWLRSIENFYRRENLKMVLGPVAIEPGRTLFGQMQSIEFASLVGSGAASLGLGLPSMCNGANLAFDRDAFIAVDGYRGTEHLASGDDEFLMHKIAHHYPGKVSFLFDPEAVVTTTPLPDWRSFARQRLRWASKWPYYQSVAPKLLAAFVFIANVCFLAAATAALFQRLDPYIFLTLAFLKFFVEFVFLKKIVKFCGKAFNTRAYILLEFFYPIYVSFFAICSKRGKYIWKGRKLA